MLVKLTPKPKLARCLLGRLRKPAIPNPGDPSSAAFPLAAGLIVPGSEVTVEAVMLNPLRTGLFETWREMGADLVHAWMSRANSFIPMGLGCPVLGWFGDYYDLKYFRRTDCYVGVTPDIAAYLRRQGTAPERTFMVNTFGTMPALEFAGKENVL